MIKSDGCICQNIWFACPCQDTILHFTFYLLSLPTPPNISPSPSSEEKLAWCLLGWAVVQMCVNVPIQAMYPACSDQPQNFYFIAIVWHLLYWILLFILVLNQGYPAKWKQNIEQVQKVDIGRSIENLESKSFLC